MYEDTYKMSRTTNTQYPTSIFDETIDRQNSNSMKWGAGKQLLTADEYESRPLPMWVADTDFRSPQPMIDALHEAVEHGVFGYPSGPTDSYLDAVINWQRKRFGWEV